METIFVSSPEIISATPNTQEKPQIDTGLACLTMLARFHSIAVDPHQIAHEYKETGKLFGVTEILLASKKLGLVTKKVKPQLGE
jgi:subfamily B ATP-binding cassette protein HlyB/CyaB